MTESVMAIGFCAAAGAAAGLVLGWLVRGFRDRRRIDGIEKAWQLRFDEAARQRDRLNAENHKLRSTIEGQQSLMHKHELAASRGRTELESARERMKAMAKDLAELAAIRDRLKTDLRTSESTLTTIRYQVADLESEFEKTGVFYKSELAKSFEKRKTAETKLDALRAERESLTTLLDSSKAENESVTRALETAQRRLGNVDEIERCAIELEAENAELRDEARRLRQEAESLKRDATELEALKAQNRDLSHCLKSMESSRKQYEIDAKRYRDQAEKSEKMSDTLRLKLDDVEKNLAEMARAGQEAQTKALMQASAFAAADGPTHTEVDDLTRIVGIGKVFERTLNDLGIYSFRQIADFGASDIARVNRALRDNKGRMEQDDWIGQARELCYQKYSEMVEH